MVAAALRSGADRVAVAAEWGPRPARFGADHRVAAVLAWHPELETVFVQHGFELIRNPILRRTVARQVSLRQACRIQGVDLAPFLELLERSRRPSEPVGDTGGAAELVQLTVP